MRTYHSARWTCRTCRRDGLVLLPAKQNYSELQWRRKFVTPAVLINHTATSPECPSRECNIELIEKQVASTDDLIGRATGRW